MKYINCKYLVFVIGCRKSIIFKGHPAHYNSFGCECSYLANYYTKTNYVAT